ncbi:hypothetical protein KXD40_000575 [Peronospora effusa]|nr:hypothetical protein KXD40_000575 [Peronospora effusa]CAI5723171.1 unnamed protein product [Peronospora effusa]
MEDVMLQRRYQLQLQERRACRRNKLKFTSQFEAHDRAPIIATTLADIEAVTSRSEFIRQQLTMNGLPSLRRWHLQLKMMIAEDLKQKGMENKDDDMETALQTCETELLRDQRCYDVVYRAGLRVSDARESLLDEGAPMDVRELLTFSTRADSFICRITCLHNGKHVFFSSSEYVEHLQVELERLLNEDSPVDAVINFIWKTLHSQQQPVE